MYGGLAGEDSNGCSDAHLSLRERAVICHVVNTIENAATDVAMVVTSASQARSLLERYRADLLRRLQRQLEGPPQGTPQAGLSPMRQARLDGLPRDPPRSLQG